MYIFKVPKNEEALLRKHCCRNIFVFEKQKDVSKLFLIHFVSATIVACVRKRGHKHCPGNSSTINVSLFAVACPGKSGHGRRRTELFTAAYMTGNFTTSRLQVLLK